jgi:DMSO/TMAO reductase YedYZ molybdopterin-dependent catalytic subunit
MSRMRDIDSEGGGSRAPRKISRRKWLGLIGAGGAAAAIGRFDPGSSTGFAWAQSVGQQGEIPGKPGMIVHSSRPVNGEFPAHLLEDDVTPASRHFVRNNGNLPPRATSLDPQGWTLRVDGEVNRALALSLEDLKRMPAVSMPLLIECGGNGRALFDPPVRGNQWERGAIGCAEWTGVRLRDVLQSAGLKPEAVYTAHYGEDIPLGAAQPFSRGIPIEKAMDEHTIIAYQMNGEDLPALNGYPVRLVVPGWIGSCSQKWLNRIWVRDRVHDSDKMKGYSYRIPAQPVTPGTRPPESDMVIATSWIIKSMINRPRAGSEFAVGEEVDVVGHAWAGDNEVTRVAVSTDNGADWKDAMITAPPNRYAWYRWESRMSFPREGKYEIRARAFDDRGNAQPFQQAWNPRGYLGNVIHSVTVSVAG